MFNIYEIPTWISFIFTIFVVVVITNGYNLIDGIDGLGPWFRKDASMFFGVAFLFNNDTDMVILSFTLLGSLLVFLKFNFNQLLEYLWEILDL